jgi:hypothetical protein
MLVGHNVLELNPATVMKALEEYLNARIVEVTDYVNVNTVKESVDSMGRMVFRLAVSPKETVK